MANQADESEASEVGRLQAARLQADYLGRLRHLLRRAPAEVREDALREVQAHIEDEWRALGGDLPALRSVLQRLGPPETYGRDLALQLILGSGPRRSPARLALAVIFWASTSLIGAVVVIAAALLVAFGLGMLVAAIGRAAGGNVALIEAGHIELPGYQADQVRFPPDGWSPALIALVGLLPALLLLGGLYRFLSLWVRSRLAQRGLALVGAGQPPVLSRDWERRALAAMLLFAVLGMTGCLAFGIIGQLIPVGRPGMVRLPDDFFRTPVTLLAFVSGLVFLVSPVLGLLWAARRSAKMAGAPSAAGKIAPTPRALPALDSPAATAITHPAGRFSRPSRPDHWSGG